MVRVMDRDDDFGGFHRDHHVLDRRRALGVLAGAGAAGLLAACTSGDTSTSDTGTAPTASTSGATAAASTAAPGTAVPTTVPPSPDGPGPGDEIPDETGGPFPADGTNGPNALTTSGVEKADLTTSFGDLSGVAEGIPIRFDLHVVDAVTGAPLPDAAVYLWHCTADARYSIYEIDDQNYLRGLQPADAAGIVTFTSIFPGCYRGRWPHAHFEVFATAAAASNGADAVKGSQLAIPEAPCEQVYSDGAYGDSASNLAQLSLDTDGVFRDGWSDQLATVTGSNARGYVASLLVRI